MKMARGRRKAHSLVNRVAEWGWGGSLLHFSRQNYTVAYPGKIIQESISITLSRMGIKYHIFVSDYSTWSRAQIELKISSNNNNIKRVVPFLYRCTNYRGKTKHPKYVVKSHSQWRSLMESIVFGRSFLQVWKIIHDLLLYIKTNG